MIWLSGVVYSDVITHPKMGLMLTPLMGNRPPLARTAWGADNGCFKQPHRFSLAGYLAFLEERAAYRDTCLFATAPDVVGDAVATWERSRPVLPVLRGLGYKAALVGQDGLEHLRIDWDAFDVLFIGGSTQWKLSEAAYALTAEASWRGKWTHMGRVNSLRRLRAAQVAGYDSTDGTFLARSPDLNFWRAAAWIRELDQQESLWRNEAA